ncbi:MAG TPA: hypothetical protein VFB29_15085 [Pseudolabrys sp.]|nr:hypothetical protein [Pseudolabrys sp.]
MKGLGGSTLAVLVLAGGLLAGALPGRAQPPDVDVSQIGILPPSTILAGVRYVGLDPVGEPVRRGAYYVLHAFDGSGVELRVVADAQFGDILFMGPALNAALTPPYVRAAKIIQIPPPGESGGKN